MALFAGAGEAQRAGEGTPTYLHNPRAAEQIARFIPNVRLIAILRNPVDRAYSHYLMDAGQLNESRRFEEIIGPELAAFGGKPAPEGPPPIQSGYLYIGLYWNHLKRFQSWFAPEQLKIILYDDYANRRDESLKDLCGFLGIDPHFDFTSTVRVMESFSVRQAGIMNLMKRLHVGRFLFRLMPMTAYMKVRSAGMKRLTEKPKPMPPAARAALLDFYRPEILRLQELLGRDLSAWLVGSPAA